ncbi:hypothetical protein AVEN_213476-1 [Araneus ventricosus]|uniref:Uncharacterized protein n=1 Tax=Araneus ventricosus TaxID=182803 RepID=A0A4Y2TJH0_ARAVE|nr:hypothetical protein AVEN_213476-1 [Araneus ventricosus]
MHLDYIVQLRLPRSVCIPRTGSRGGLVLRSRLWGGGFQVRNPIPLKIRRVWSLLNAKSYVVAKRPPVGVEWKLGEGAPAQVQS